MATRWNWHQTLHLLTGVALAGVLAFGCSAASRAQEYPLRPVKVVVPFPPGGPLDSTARLLAEKLSASLKQPFIVENRPGGSGNIGAEAVAKAAADGYTLLVSLDTPLTVNPSLFSKLAFDPLRDFTPLSTLASFSLTLVVHPSVPVNSVAEFVSHAKASRERPLLFGSGGGGGDPGHLTMEYFRMQAGFEALHVPFKGNAEVVMGLVGGHVQSGFLATPGVLQSVRDGRLKALAVSSLHRTPLAPDIPTVAESGLPDFDVRFYQVMLAPAGIPDATRTVLQAAVQHAMQSPDIQSRLQIQAVEPIANTGAETDALLKSTAARWRTVIQSAQIQRR